jgi:hypothetical protein
MSTAGSRGFGPSDDTLGGFVGSELSGRTVVRVLVSLGWFCDGRLMDPNAAIADIRRREVGETGSDGVRQGR